MDETPRIYVLVRTDLVMPSGKFAAQVWHAGEGALEDCERMNPAAARRYRCSELRTKIVLEVDSLEDLERVHQQCVDRHIPSHLVTDAGKTVFDKPTVTALGIGPVVPEQAPGFVQHAALHDEPIGGCQHDG